MRACFVALRAPHEDEHLAGARQYSHRYTLNHDGVINVVDATEIQKIIVNLV